MTIVTTQQIQNKIEKIAESFIEIICSYGRFKDTNIEFALLLNKINSNVQAIMILVSKGMHNEAKIIFRSMFETLVLLEYLLEYPKEIERYRLDDLIAEFNQIYAGYKRKLIKKSEVIEAYNKIKDRLTGKIEFEKKLNGGIIIFDDLKLEKNLKNYKPLSQNVYKLIDKLKKKNNIHSEQLFFLQYDFYNYNSQICHNRLNTLIHRIKNNTDDKILIDIQTIYKDCAMVYKMLFEILESKFQYKQPQEFYNKLVQFGEYLGIQF